MPVKGLREHVVALLKSEEAHLSFDAVVKDLPRDLRGKKPEGTEHSAWELLEHLRIAQRDILEFSRDPRHVSPDFPSGYWPAAAEPPNEAAWDASVAAFQADLRQFCEMVSSESIDLLAPLPHGDGQTVLREALLVADHNAYHLGQLVSLRRLLGAWTKS